VENQPSTVIEPTPQQELASDKLWISREEYSQLKAMQNTTPVTVMQDTQNSAGSNPLLIIGLICALALFLSFSFPGFGFLAGPAILAFLIIGVMSIAKTHGSIHKAGSSRSSKAVKWLVIAGLLVLLSPFIYFIGMMMIFFLLMAVSGGDVGS
jgi:hypothetical protein